MASDHEHFVANGGWVTRESFGRPKAQLLTFVSLLWLAVSVIASASFWFELPESFSALEWLCLALIVPEPFLIGAAVWLWITEKPRVVTEFLANPDYDPQKLY